MNGDKTQFAERLREAMHAAGLQPRPSVLVNMFNLEHRGASVTFQTASRWLKGVSIPDASKVRTLARILGQRPEVLMFGSNATVANAETVLRVPLFGRQERQLLEAFARLQPEDRKLVRALIQRLDDSAR